VTALAPDRAAGAGSRYAQLARLFTLAALLSGLAWLMVDQPQRGWQGAARYPVTLEGAHYQVDARQLEWLRAFTALHFSDGERSARALAAAEIDARLDAAFAGVSARLPAFADWYYSLAGEYARLSMLALSWANLADEDFVARRATALLFPEGAWDTDLTALEQHTAERLLAHHEQVRSGWLAELTARLAQQRVPAPLPSDLPQGESVRLDALANQILVSERAALSTRASVATVTATGVAAGPALWRAASRRMAAGGGRPALARAAGRGAARAGSAAAGGAALCAPGGPVAFGCAVAAGAAAWVAADWALLRIDEAMHREQLLAAIEESLGILRNDLQRDLLAAYDGMIARHYDTVQADIRESFVPIRAQ
jgi:hypothetical protein